MLGLRVTELSFPGVRDGQRCAAPGRWRASSLGKVCMRLSGLGLLLNAAYVPHLHMQ